MERGPFSLAVDLKRYVQPPFRGPAAPGPGDGFGLVDAFAEADREKALAVPIVALALRSSIFLRSISSYL